MMGEPVSIHHHGTATHEHGIAELGHRHGDGLPATARPIAELPAEPVELAIQTVSVSNDDLADADMELHALAAIAYGEGPHQGLHFLVRFRPGEDSYHDACILLDALIEASAFPYVVVERGA